MEVLKTTEDLFDDVLDVAIDNLPGGAVLRLHQGVKVTRLPHHVSKAVCHLWHELVTESSINVAVKRFACHHSLQRQDVSMREQGPYVEFHHTIASLCVCVRVCV